MTQIANRGDTKTRRGFYFSKVSSSLWLNRILLWLLPLSFLSIAFFHPLSRILALTLDPATLTPQNLLLASRVLLFTFYQAALLPCSLSCLDSLLPISSRAMTFEADPFCAR